MQAPQMLVFSLIAAALIGVLVALILTYPSANRGDTLRKALHEQAKATRALESEKELLQLQLQEVTRSSELLQEDLLAARRELLERERDVTFYRGLLSPEELERGFKLHTVSLFTTDQPDIYEYEVVVAHVDGRGRKVAGNLQLSLIPAIEAFPQELQSDASAADDGSQPAVFKEKVSHRLGFRFFQRVSGQIKLPANFEPDTIIVKGSSNLKRGSNAFEQYFDWSALLGSAQFDAEAS